MQHPKVPLPAPADVQVPGPEQVLARLERAAVDRDFLRTVMEGSDGEPQSQTSGSVVARHVAAREVPQIQDDDFANMGLERIIHGVAGPRPIDPNAIDSYRLGWQRAGATLAELYEAFDRAMAKAIDAGWQGTAGAAATAALADYVRQTAGLVEGAQTTAAQLWQLRDAMAETSSRVAGLRQALGQMRVEATAGPMSRLIPGFSADSVVKAAAEVQRDAQQVMTGTYRPGVQAAYTGIPELPRAGKPVAPPTAPTADPAGVEGGVGG
jgi:hypothetical protein